MTKRVGKVAWIAGAASGIGKAAALALGQEGWQPTALTSRRAEPRKALADNIRGVGGEALVAAGDVTDPDAVIRIVSSCVAGKARFYILVNNTGGNVRERRWVALRPAGVDAGFSSKLASAFNCATAAMKVMRPNRDAMLIHTATWAGRFLSPVSGAAYTAAKHGVTVMRYAIHVEGSVNGIRSPPVLTRSLPVLCSTHGRSRRPRLSATSRWSPPTSVNSPVHCNTPRP
jgi:NAD(P)-dependent dehydrogenase (short-subunit alcohol dehydrogenase family)